MATPFQCKGAPFSTPRPSVANCSNGFGDAAAGARKRDLGPRLSLARHACDSPIASTTNRLGARRRRPARSHGSALRRRSFAMIKDDVGHDARTTGREIDRLGVVAVDAPRPDQIMLAARERAISAILLPEREAEQIASSSTARSTCGRLA